MTATFRLTPLRRLANALMKPLIRFGLAPRRTRLLRVTGRRTGRTYETPINLVVRGDERYLVSPYGDRSWAINARALGRVVLVRGRREEAVGVEPVDAQTAGPVLRQYWLENAITRGFFSAGRGAAAVDFAAEADRHPVFRVLRLDNSHDS